MGLEKEIKERKMTENVEKNEKNIKERVLDVVKSTWFWGLALFILLLIVDQVTKIWADWYFVEVMAGGNPYLVSSQKIEIIPGWLNLCITYNRGISYGMGNNSPMGLKIFVVAMTAVLMGVFTWVFIKTDKRRTLLRVALVFVVAGGVGNLIDRVYYQVWDPATNDIIRDGVRDMVDLSRFGFAVCNFADFFISAGAVMLVLSLLFFDSEAMFPMTEKYKALAKESAEEEQRKLEEKAAAAFAKAQAEKQIEENNTQSQKENLEDNG